MSLRSSAKELRAKQRVPEDRTYNLTWQANRVKLFESIQPRPAVLLATTLERCVGHVPRDAQPPLTGRLFCCRGQPVRRACLK